MGTDFVKSLYTVVVSDIHLSDAEPPHPRNALWKRFKRPKYFIDKSFKNFLIHLESTLKGPIELVLNGDIFDFDSVMVLPKDKRFSLNFFERLRGMNAEEAKSRFKMKTILQDHFVWLEALRNFVMKGNRVVFVIGNHDMELHWPSVRLDIVNRLNLPEHLRDHVRFCEWFYISNKDTLIEHGNQYDAYCLCLNPIHPLIKKASKIHVRLPFGNLANRYMLNGMGLMNPHADSSFIKSSLTDYFMFFFKYAFRTQPLLFITWAWSSMVTLIFSVGEGLLPAMSDPMTVDTRVEDIAQRANATPNQVWALKELQVHSAIFAPWRILRELWLDRAIMAVFIVFFSFQFFSFMNVFTKVSYWWFIVPNLLLFPFFVFYAKSVRSEVEKIQSIAAEKAPIAARIAKVKRVVNGHTHKEKHAHLEGIEYINTGTWSPAYHDVECTKPYGRKCYALIEPDETGRSRKATLLEWRDPDSIEVKARLSEERPTEKFKNYLIKKIS